MRVGEKASDCRREAVSLREKASGGRREAVSLREKASDGRREAISAGEVASGGRREAVGVGGSASGDRREAVGVPEESLDRCRGALACGKGFLRPSAVSFSAGALSRRRRSLPGDTDLQSWSNCPPIDRGTLR